MTAGARQTAFPVLRAQVTYVAKGAAKPVYCGVYEAEMPIRLSALNI
jgi:hypothetical protein